MSKLNQAALRGAVLLLAATSVTGCATRAGSVAPVAVAASDYRGLNCDQARDELVSVRAKQTALTRRQNNAALTDAAGVLLFLIPVGSIVGADVSGELAQAKGETMALERHIKSGCHNSVGNAWTSPTGQTWMTPGGHVVSRF